MFDNPSQLEFNLASIISGCAGVISCWLIQRIFAPQEKSGTGLTRAEQANISDITATRKLRAAEDELALRWLNEKEGSVSSRELALTHIAYELLPFNPIAGPLLGNTTESDMLARVERIEKLLASVDPPESLGTLPTAQETVPAIRDPHGRQNPHAEDPQRRRSDQAIMYDALLRRCLGDDDFAWRMLHKFPLRCRAELESLSTELQRRAWTAATRRINQLRGMAANIAAENLRDALANLENVCRQQSATRADQLLEGVYGEFQQVLDFIDRAGGEPPRAERTTDENQPLSHWPASLRPAEDQDPLQLETSLAGKSS